MKNICFLLVLISSLGCLAQAQTNVAATSSVPNIYLQVDAETANNPVKFYNGNIEGAFIKAREERKLIFVDFYASWCGPCKVIEKETFTSADFYTYVNQNYVALKIYGDNFDTGELDYATRYDVKEYPTLMVLNYKGEEIGRISGYKTPYIYLTELKRLERFAAYKR